MCVCVCVCVCGELDGCELGLFCPGPKGRRISPLLFRGGGLARDANVLLFVHLAVLARYGLVE